MRPATQRALDNRAPTRLVMRAPMIISAPDLVVYRRNILCAGESVGTGIADLLPRVRRTRARGRSNLTWLSPYLKEGATRATTGVRLSTPEGCDLGFYGCGDAGVPTGSRLRIVITAGGRWRSRSVYRAGPVQRAPLGPPQGTAAAHGRPGTAIFCPSGDTPPEMPQAADAKGKHRRSLSTSSRGALRCFPSRRYLLPSPPARTQPSLPSAPARAPRPGLRSFPARPGAITARRRPATLMPP